MAGRDIQAGFLEEEMSELVSRTDRFDEKGGRGGTPGRESAQAPSVSPRAPEPPHLDTVLSPLLWVFRPPLGRVDAPFPRTWEPPSQRRQDSLVAPCLVG